MATAVSAVRSWSIGALARPKSQEDRRRASFEALVAHDWDRFHRYALHLCRGNGDDAEDLLSETMVDAFRAFDAFRGDGFDRWFFRMLTTNRIDMLRRAKIRRAQSLDARWQGHSGETPALEIADASQAPERVLDDIYSEAMQQALDTLPESFRAPVLLCDVEGLDYEEIARTLQIPLGTVRSRIHRARTRMRETLEKLGWRG